MWMMLHTQFKDSASVLRLKPRDPVSLFVFLMLYATEQKNHGITNMQERDVSVMTRIRTAKKNLKLLIEESMVHITEDGFIAITNFEKYQNQYVTEGYAGNPQSNLPATLQRNLLRYRKLTNAEKSSGCKARSKGKEWIDPRISELLEAGDPDGLLEGYQSYQSYQVTQSNPGNHEVTSGNHEVTGYQKNGNLEKPAENKENFGLPLYIDKDININNNTTLLNCERDAQNENASRAEKKTQSTNLEGDPPESQNPPSPHTAEECQAKLQQLKEAGGAALALGRWELEHMGEVRKWLDAGCDFEQDILQTVRAKCAIMRPQSLTTWRFFQNIVLDAKEKRLQGLPSAVPRAYIAGDPPVSKLTKAQQVTQNNMQRAAQIKQMEMEEERRKSC